MKIYVASSWRNNHQPEIVKILRKVGHKVYDFRNPKPGDNGFQWSEIDPNWQSWSPSEFQEALTHPIAERGFGLDWEAMGWADAGVMVMPCGRSAHLEAGYFVGAGKKLFILLDNGEPELMYNMADHVCVDESELLSTLEIQELKLVVGQ
ncbi:MAG: hypothetical protein GY865_16125 [candidate division Zixibacteria bacterium]|nr:hypothetical protein [candidate division Zixibacteria bacterium]